MAALTTEQRNRLPDSIFGLPETRQYPMDTRNRAINAKARARQQLNAGNLSREDFNRIIRKADKILGKREDDERKDGFIRYDNISGLQARIDSETGFLYDTPILTRTGVFPYRQPDGSIRREYRSPEEVFKADSLSSYKGKPITIRHPEGGVTSKNAREKNIGTILSEGRKDGDNVRSDIVIHVPEALGNNRELSNGYRVDIEDIPGKSPEGEEYDCSQKNIRLNHLAVVSKARAGREARLNYDGDEVDEIAEESNLNEYNQDEDLYQTELNKQKPQEKQGGNQMPKTKLDGIEYEAAQEVINALEKEQARADASEAQRIALQKEIDKLTAERDALNAKISENITKLRDMKEDSEENIKAIVKARVELLKTAESFRVDKADDMDDKDIKIAVIKAVRGDEFDPKDKSDDYINAAFDFAKADKRSDAMSEQRKKIYNHEQRSDAAPTSAEESRQKMIDRQTKAYLGEEKGGK